MHEFIMKLLDRFSGMFRRAGIDYPALRTIVRIKLTMDGRKPNGVLEAIGKSKKPSADKPEKSPFAVNWLYVLMSLAMIPFLFLNDSLAGMTFVFTLLMFFQGTAMIADFSSVMLDTRDRSILRTKPVDGRTLGMAKTVHIIVYLFLLTASLVALPLMAVFVFKGAAAGLVFLLEIMLVTGLDISLTAAVYYAVLRLWDGERLKDMINYIQIALAVGLMVGYQIMIRIFDFSALGAGFEPGGWWLLAPPVWFGAPFGLLQGNGGISYVFAACALLVPLLSVLLYVLMLPQFEQQVQKLTQGGGAGKRRSAFRPLELIGDLLIRNPRERAFYRFACAMMGKEREFKLKVYPSVGFSMVVPFIFMASQLKAGLDSLSVVWGLMLYGTGLAIPTLLTLLSFSSRHKAAWIYSTSPMEETGAVHRGAVLASLIKLFLPVFAVAAVVFLLLFGKAFVPDLIAVFLSLLLFAVVCYRILPRKLPFSEPFPAGSSSQNGLQVFLLIVILTAFGGIHFGIRAAGWPYSVWIFSAALIGLNYVAWKYGFRGRSTGKAASAK
ncbi:MULTISPECIES: hypothetical protein [unclassified Paenibacillus]|uniref:hypothetical protein n=1 Tax=unclassified Paenibacillus TaxID=185978 RepID=UPI000955DD25|nr:MULTISPECIES: hypothetical protein [unclassified Paenibacillus]ASS68651.1 hypothetical protein CIC07_22825 [Paenibacillus sp. RUD330]SIR54961.1 hypothetical protein SAMN05880555_4162 [Paenibacillus sp. RU4X]SIR63473.1 hypothetical protein SAMN05880570_4164 [Paenibacillus sp. RU4T]